MNVCIDGQIYRVFLTRVIVDKLIKHTFQMFESLVKPFSGYGGN